MNRCRRASGKSMRVTPASFAGVTCLIAAWVGSAMSPGQDKPSILKLSIIDETTKQPTPARVEVLDKDGHAHVAADALLIGGD